MTPWRMDIWKSTLGVQWSIHIHLKAFIIIICAYCCDIRYWKRLPDNVLKLKESLLLRSFHMVQVLYLIILLSLFQALVSDDYSNFFSDTRVFAVPCIKYVQYPWGCAVLMRHTRSTSEAQFQYPWETFNEWQINKISSQVLNTLTDNVGVPHR